MQIFQSIITFINANALKFMTTVKDRLTAFLEEKGINKSEFGRRIGVSSAFITSMRKSIQPDKVRSIKEQFPDLNIEWLLTGEGEMTIDADKNSELKIVGGPKEAGRLIPFYDAETTGGYEGRVSSSTEEATLKGYIQAGGWFNGRETAAIRHVGDSMIEYPNGCVLAVREVTERRLLVPGQNYVIETMEYRITKRVQRGSSPDTIALYSTNQEKYEDGRLIYEPFEISLEDVRRIFSVLGYIVNQSGEFRLIKP